ncbi:MAG: diacylglycerol kinase family protein [Zhongshania sp.]|uniref:diacylglycerol kinase family protein n=1 Tax=Zhongshania sp. TaxID=1971902 RepID=UPI00262311E8|nr:diacylglycerol kinase family protein [Zhongshania sp.]MDF1691920.1 diacylglycerol kinase family protein [Zhongshania sp.]
MRTKTERRRRGSKFSLLDRFSSLRDALNGLGILIVEQHNARIHLFAAICVVALGLLTGLSGLEWILVFAAIALVWLAEAFNSALEYVCDAAVPETHELVGKAKDVAAAGVLISAGFAVVVGVWVFVPGLLR